MEIKKVTDRSFRKYGRVLEGYDFTELIKAMEQAPLPDGVIYEPSVDYLEALPIAQEFKTRAYGELDVQIGFCNGHNKKLNAAEYHRSSELNIACTDAVLIIGSQTDVEEDNTYDTSKMEAFLVPAGMGVEVFATTLHYAPCSVNGNNFRCVVVLPKDTNLDLEVKPEGAKEDPLLVARNKWLIAHEEAGIEGAQGVSVPSGV